MKIQFAWRRLAKFVRLSSICSVGAVCATLAVSADALADYIPNAIQTVTATAGANADGASYETQVVNGNGLSVGNPLVPSTWAHDNDWTHGWQMNYSNGSPPSSQPNAWFTIDLGSVHSDLDQAVIWNVREATDRGTKEVNVFYGTAPTTGTTDGQSVSAFNVSDGWTQLLSDHTIPQSPPGGTSGGNNSAQDDAISLTGITARYISFQILSNWGGVSLARTGFAEIQVTTAVPEPSSVILLGLGLAGVGLTAARRHRKN